MGDQTNGLGTKEETRGKAKGTSPYQISDVLVLNCRTIVVILMLHIEKIESSILIKAITSHPPPHHHSIYHPNLLSTLLTLISQTFTNKMVSDFNLASLEIFIVGFY